MGNACSTYVRDEKYIQNFVRKNRRDERDHWEDQGVDERIMLEWIFGK
jgi:hypothetical protein